MLCLTLAITPKLEVLQETKGGPEPHISEFPLSILFSGHKLYNVYKKIKVSLVEYARIGP